MRTTADDCSGLRRSLLFCVVFWCFYYCLAGRQVVTNSSAAKGLKTKIGADGTFDMLNVNFSQQNDTSQNKVPSILENSSQHNSSTSHAKVALHDSPRHHVEMALDMISKWFPEHPVGITLHSEEHKNASLHNLLSSADASPYMARLFENCADNAQSNTTEAATPLRPCANAIVNVVVDAVVLAFDVFGLQAKNRQRVAQSIAQKMRREDLATMKNEVYELSRASEVVAQSEAIFKLLKSVWNAGGFFGGLHLISEQMNCWEWLRTRATFLANFIMWFASDGAALLVKAEATLMSTLQIALDAKEATKLCSEKTDHHD